MEKDAVIAALGAAAALAGLVLVFEGITIATLQSFPGDTEPAVTDAYRLSARLLAGVFAASLASVALSFAWLLSNGPDWLFPWTAGLFLAQLGAILVVSVFSVLQLAGR